MDVDALLDADEPNDEPPPLDAPWVEDPPPELP